MTRFFLIFTLAFSIALLITYYTKGFAAPIFRELLSGFIVINLITGTLSYTLYAYVDSIIKDVSADEATNNQRNYSAAINRLTDLKKEILQNVFAVVGLLVLERIVHGISLIFPVNDIDPFNWPWACALSVRVACFSLSVFVAAIQFRGFIIANEFRAVISRAK